MGSLSLWWRILVVKSFRPWKVWGNSIQEFMGSFGKPADRVLSLLPFSDQLWAANVSKQKFLQYGNAMLIDSNDSSAIAAAMKSLVGQGFSQRKITLLVNSSSCQMEHKRYPPMTEEELEESMYWEEDRIFRTSEAVVLGYRVLAHDEGGYDLLLFAWPRRELDIWVEAAKIAGKKLIAIKPVMDVLLQETPYFILLGGHKDGTLLYCDGMIRRYRKVTMDEEAIGATFIKTVIEQHHTKEVSFFLCPRKDGTEEEMNRWYAWLQREIQIAKDNDSFPLDISPIDSWSDEFSTWSMVQPIFLHGNSGQAQFALSNSLPQPFFSKENRMLRVAQGAALAGTLFFLYTMGHAISLGIEEKEMESALRKLSPVREQMKEQQLLEQQEFQKLEFLKKLETEDPHWEQKLVLLADAMPEGVVLSEIKGEGRDIQIIGTASSPMGISSIEKQIRAIWGGNVRMAKRKYNQRTGLLEFSLAWKPSDEKAKK